MAQRKTVFEVSVFHCALARDPLKAQVKKAEDVLRDLEAAIQKARKLIAESKQLISDSKATHDAKASDEEKPSS